MFKIIKFLPCRLTDEARREGLLKEGLKVLESYNKTHHLKAIVEIIRGLKVD